MIGRDIFFVKRALCFEPNNQGLKGDQVFKGYQVTVIDTHVGPKHRLVEPTLGMWGRF